MASGFSLAGQRALLTTWLVATDAFALFAAFRLAYWVRFEVSLTVAPEVVARVSDYLLLSAMLVVLWLTVFLLFNLYDPHAKLGGIVESSRVFNACTTSTMLVIVATFVLPQFVVARLWLISVWVLSFAAVAANRFAARRVVYAFRRRGYLLAPAVIVGTNQEAVSLAGFLADWLASGVRVVGFVSTEPGDEGRLPCGVLGRVGDIQATVVEHGIEDVIVAITGVRREQLLRLCEDLEHLPVQLRLSSGLYELVTTRVTVQTLGTVPFMSLQKNRLERGEVVIKTCLECMLAVLALALLWPLLLLVAFWIKLDSPGPVFHRRRVLGTAGRSFGAFKFRTMHVNAGHLLAPGAAEELQSNHKLKDDPRVTSAGRTLRRYSIDELPQLFNVLLGQMALVGPRMITAEESEKYGRQRITLLTVKPGITGLWQVSGRSELTYDERIAIDMHYVRNYSVWLDLQILFIHTLPAVLKGRGAY